jgi:putative transposase
MSSSSSPHWDAASPEDWAIAAARESVIRPLVEAGQVSVAIASEAAKTLGISRSMLYRLIARFRAQAELTTLLPRSPGRTHQPHRLSKTLERLIATTIDEVYLQRERPRLADLMRVVNARCHAAGVEAPDYRTVKRRVAEIGGRTRTKRRHGARAARQRFGPVQASSLNPDFPLDVVQIDHTEVDVIVVDERDRLPLGRPWLTLAIDVATRVILGFSVSLEAPSTVSVAQVLTHAVLPKDVWLADRELEVPWPTFGMPRTLHLDNWSEFHSETLARGARQYGIRLEFRPMAQPHFGGHIERLIGRMMGAVHLLRGTTFANTVAKGDYDSEKSAVLTLSELERWLALEIAGVYHHSIHAALSTSPLAAWQDRLAKRPQPLHDPVDRQTFFLDFLPGEHRLVRRDGIQLFWLHYWDNVLSPWAGRSTKRMLVNANALTLRELIDAAAARHPGAGIDHAFLDDALPHSVAVALAQFARLPESIVRRLDLTDELPGCLDSWILRAPALQVGWQDRVADQRAAYTFCPACLASSASESVAAYLPVEWACAVVTHCPTHHARLQERCPACVAYDPFVIGVGEQPDRAECWQCEGALGLEDWPADRSAAVEPVLRLQSALITSLRDRPSPLNVMDPPNVRMVADLLDLLVDDEDGEPAFARVAAVHWPLELTVVGHQISESRFAYLPARVRFLAMACAAVVMVEADAVMSESLVRARHTLATSLADHEWRRWQQHMVHWPARMRQALNAARGV